MAYYGNGPRSGGYGGPRQGGGYGGNNRQNPYQNGPAQQPLAAEALPGDYADKAEDVIRKLGQNRITTSKLRRLLALLIPIYNEENLRSEPELTADNRAALQLARIRMLYEAGREQSVKEFIGNARLVEYLKGVEQARTGSRQKLLDYYHYMEALVAYHKFYGGKEE